MINRGTETAYDVAVTVPENAALDLRSTDVGHIAKIPGGGRSVTVDVFNTGRMMGGPRQDNAFDVSITARTEAGEQVTQDVFLDLNGS